MVKLSRYLAITICTYLPSQRSQALKDGDTLQQVLDAPDREELLAWVRSRPLAHFEEGVLFVHAGVLPSWTVEQTLSLADEVHRSLAADNDKRILRQMYGDEPAMERRSQRQRSAALRGQCPHTSARVVVRRNDEPEAQGQCEQSTARRHALVRSSATPRATRWSCLAIGRLKA